MTRDLDTLLRDADPLRGATDDDAALLPSLRERVDRERSGVPAGAQRPDWRRRVALVAAAAAVLTAVPVVVGLVGGDDGGPPPLLPPAVAADASIVCGTGYASAIAPGDVDVRLLPEELPDGWSYTQIFAREDSAAVCIPASLVALRSDADGLLTGRISVTGPVDATVDQGKLVGQTDADSVFGHAARRFDAAIDYDVHRWSWTDHQGKQWSADVTGLPLEEARQALSAVSIDGPRVVWDGGAAPGWTLVHLRDGDPYGVPYGRLTWWVDLTDGAQARMLQVWLDGGPDLPVLAGAAVGDRLTTVDGRAAVLGRPRGGEANGGPPGSEPTTPVIVEVAPGTFAFSWATDEDLADVERMLASLRQVAGDDPRLEQYGTD